MKRNLFLGVLFCASSLIAAESNPKAAIKKAAEQLAAQPNYSWKTTVEAGGGRFTPGPTEGKTEKSGLTCLSMTRGNNTIEAVIKGSKAAVKRQDTWEAVEEPAAAGQGGGRGRFLARILRNYKTPVEQAEHLADLAQNLKSTDGMYSGDLNEQGVADLLTSGRRNAPAPANAKGSVKFWVTDGRLSKLQYALQATLNFNGNDVDLNRTTTVEISDVGKTKVDVPAEAARLVE